MVLDGWPLTEDAVRPMANLALFSSFSNILFIPPFKKYSWQTLRRQYENSECESAGIRAQKHILQAQDESDFWVMSWKAAVEVLPATPFDAALSFTFLCPVVIGEILHGQGVFTQCLFILTVLTPDLVKVSHFGVKKEKGKKKKQDNKTYLDVAYTRYTRQFHSTVLKEKRNCFSNNHYQTVNIKAYKNPSGISQPFRSLQPVAR